MTEPRKYRYKVSLRISHPSLPPEQITAILGLEPSRSWTAGQTRRTPKGSPLPGEYKDCYWSHSFDTPMDGELEAFALGVLSNLAIHADTFRGAADSGGKTELFIGLFMETSNVELYFSAALHAKCAELGVCLYLDIYDPDRTDSDAA